jgi:hypothetical protein
VQWLLSLDSPTIEMLGVDLKYFDHVESFIKSKTVLTQASGLSEYRCLSELTLVSSRVVANKPIRSSEITRLPETVSPQWISQWAAQAASPCDKVADAES